MLRSVQRRHGTALRYSSIRRTQPCSTRDRSWPLWIGATSTSRRLLSEWIEWEFFLVKIKVIDLFVGIGFSSLIFQMGKKIELIYLAISILSWPDWVIVQDPVLKVGWHICKHSRALLHKKIVGIKAKSKSKIRIKPKSRCIKLSEIKPKLNSFKMGKKVTFYGCHGNGFILCPKGPFLMSTHLCLISGTYVWFWSIIKLGLIHGT